MIRDPFSRDTTVERLTVTTENRIGCGLLSAIVFGPIFGLLGRFVIGPMIYPVGSHIDSYEDLQWWGVGLVALVVFLLVQLLAQLLASLFLAVIRARRS